MHPDLIRGFEEVVRSRRESERAHKEAEEARKKAERAQKRAQRKEEERKRRGGGLPPERTLKSIARKRFLGGKVSPPNPHP